MVSVLIPYPACNSAPLAGRVETLVVPHMLVTQAPTEPHARKEYKAW